MLSASLIIAALLLFCLCGAMGAVTLAEAQEKIDCKAFLEPIHARREPCLAAHNGTAEVDICVYFASDYEFLVPFLVHHLALGARRIFIYNNDDKVHWYQHPAILCLLAEQLVEVQPWYGDRALMKGLDHCAKRKIPESMGIRHEEGKMPPHVWAVNFDIDEMLVLHTHTCMAALLEHVDSASVALNWAFFTPESPMSNFGRTGNLAIMPKRDYNLHGVVLPHDKLLRRMYENEHIKTINRVTCVEGWRNEHCPAFTATCPFSHRPRDPENRSIACQSWTPWIDNHYPIAQLNHYWTLSLADFLRKIHRGKGGGYSKHEGTSYRNTGEFHAHAKPGRMPFVEDRSLIDRYGAFYADLKQRCPLCFDTSLYLL